jgi:PucR-like helix-turn-helix protein
MKYHHAAQINSAALRLSEVHSQTVDRDCIAIETPGMAAGLQSSARGHLWMHFSKMGAYADAEIPVILRGEGCHVYDSHGRRLLDGLSALYCVNAGHGRGALLLSLQDNEALRAYCDGVLAAVQDGDPAYADELLRSLVAFREHNGHWERAAEQALCHRHTLRYRIRRVEQLSGRDLSNPRDRIEFWLALRARELAR